MKRKISFPIRSRKDLRDYFERTICGYDTHLAFFPVALDVKINTCLDEDDLKKLVSTHLKDEYAIEDLSDFDAKFASVYEDDLKTGSIYWLTLENMREYFLDNELFRTDATGATHNNVAFSFVGRSGKHLCLFSFEGIHLALSSSDEFYDSIYLSPDDYNSRADYRADCAYHYQDYSVLMSLYKLTETLRVYFEEDSIHEKEFIYSYVDTLAVNVMVNSPSPLGLKAEELGVFQEKLSLAQPDTEDMMQELNELLEATSPLLPKH